MMNYIFLQGETKERLHIFSWALVWQGSRVHEDTNMHLSSGISFSSICT